MRLQCLALCVAALTSCSSSSFDQEGGDLRRSEVEALSSRMRDAVELEFPLLKHKLVTRYVDALGQSMVSRNREMPPLPYEFRVLRSNEVFAFSLPGGIIYLSLGLIRASELEGHLAAAIAHELAHQQLNHSLIVWRRKVNANRNQPYLFDFSGDWKRVFLSERGVLFLGKKMEEEADGLAPVLLYKSGFDPRVYTSYLQLLRDLEVSDTSQVAALLSLHPPFADRMRWAISAIAKIPPQKDPSLSSATFQQIKAILKEAAKQAEPTAKKKKTKKAVGAVKEKETK